MLVFQQILFFSKLRKTSSNTYAAISILEALHHLESGILAGGERQPQG